MKVKLGDIAQLQFGFYSKSEEGGNAVYLQAKHFDDWGKQSYNIDTFISINKKNEAHLLEEGDILLVGKGLRNFAWVYQRAVGPAIASSIFFVIKPDRQKALPEFLNIVFNSPQIQSYFQTLGAGSSIPSIRKSELEALPLTLPPVEVQRKTIEISRIHDQDMELSRRIMEEKQKLYQAITHNLIFNYHG
ncbi:MAG: restriction endonuclease subunit S [Cyclobacterium sp.]|uniref:restriction endonuclease subunit S n=1 Tax=Cyclobacterium sp. TaxID=1966343 RepID=UPI003970CA15